MTSAFRDCWLVSLRVPQKALPDVEAMFEGLGGALVVGEVKEGSLPLELYLAEKLDEGWLTSELSALAAARGESWSPPSIEKLPDVDWVAESQKALPPISAGPFFVYGSHVKEAPPKGSIPLLIEANTAFGTGRHESTRGCLEMLARLAKGWCPKSALDMGCGSGVLAFAIARLWNISVLAVDNDTESVRVAAENAEKNGLSEMIIARESDGYASDAVQECRPFDLICANILAEPLCAMAPGLEASLAPGGYAVLSGILVAQKDQVLAAHQGLDPVDSLVFGDWITLLLKKA
jgi:ribosomal protein L11 methyltransferase